MVVAKVRIRTNAAPAVQSLRNTRRSRKSMKKKSRELKMAEGTATITPATSARTPSSALSSGNKTFNYDDVGGSDDNDKSCCSLDGINDARMVAAKLGFPHYVLDFSEAFGVQVIDNFVDEYMHGRTPNPCVICNRKIKWEEMIRKSLKLGADYIATGHYARVRKDEETSRYVISRGKDAQKDQSYALWGLTQDSLRRTVFPLA